MSGRSDEMVGGFTPDGHLATMPVWRLLGGRQTLILDGPPPNPAEYGDEPRSVVPLDEATLVSSACGSDAHPARHLPVLDLDRAGEFGPAEWLKVRDLLCPSAPDDGWMQDPNVACWVPSSTPGHGHLYVGREVKNVPFMEALMALATHKLIEPGYAVASIRRWSAHVRLPWVSKDVPLHREKKIREEPF